jgi:UDP-N-acetylglucosamine 2-epimerase
VVEGNIPEHALVLIQFPCMVAKNALETKESHKVATIKNVPVRKANICRLWKTW